jgi:hypothetical protein
MVVLVVFLRVASSRSAVGVRGLGEARRLSATLATCGLGPAGHSKPSMSLDVYSHVMPADEWRRNDCESQ